MYSSLHQGIQLAEGYDFTDRLTSPYRLAYGHMKRRAMPTLSNVDGSEPQELHIGDAEQSIQVLCFSPDGRTCYFVNEYIYARHLTNGSIRRLDGTPPLPENAWLSYPECSPDNRTLVFVRTDVTWTGGGRGSGSPFRLCRISTDGSGLRVLYEDPLDYHLQTISCCWQQGFAVFIRLNQTGSKLNHELVKVDLESGDLELIGHPANPRSSLIIHPDGKRAAWAEWRDGISLCSLESGAIEKLLSSGSQPAWSPDGTLLAYMEDQHCLCLMDMASGHSRSMVWFEPPNLSYKQRRGSFAVQPIWSLDSRMLWFALTQTRKLPPPRTLSEVFHAIKHYIYPFLHNMNPKRTSHRVGYRRHYHHHRKGILDLCTRQIVLSTGHLSGVVWLPSGLG